MEQTRTPVGRTPAMSVGRIVAQFVGRRSSGELAAAILLAAASGAVLILASDFPETNGTGPGPGLFPTLVGIGLLCLSAIRIAQLTLSARRGRQAAAQVTPAPDDVDTEAPRETEADRASPAQLTSVVRFVALSLAQFAYAYLLPLLGFVIATTCLAFALLVILGRRPVRSLIEAVVAVTLLYLAFASGLGVVLPMSTIPWLANLGL